MTTSDRVVVVGASIGGLTVAETLRQEGFDGEIVLVGDEAHLPYTRPPLSKQILLGEWEPRDAAIRTGDELAGLHIQVRTGCAGTALDMTRRVLRTTDGSIPFDELVIATGTVPRAHPALPHAPTLRTMDDALRLRKRLRTDRRVAVVGSGILGSEIASAARKHDAETLLIGRSGTLGFGGAGTSLSDDLARLHEENGVRLALRADVVDASDGRLRFADGTEHPVELVVTMIGGVPRTDWLRGSSLDLTDGIACDSSGAAAPGVWAVGDVAAWADPLTGRRARVEHQSHAIEQGIAVATRLARGESSTTPVPLFWSEIHGTRIHAYGWFDPRRPLENLTPDPNARGRVLGSRDTDDVLRGVIGWNASPRDFRAARADVAAAASVSQPSPQP